MKWVWGMLLLALLLLLLACLLREAYREVTSSVVSGLKEVCSKVWECVVLKEAYQDAVDGYLIAAGEDVETQHENGKSAGRGIKHYLKDLWTAFILVDALLIASSITPFSQAATQAQTARDATVPFLMMPNAASCSPTGSASLCAYHHDIFGLLWSVTVSLNCFALSISMLLLGYMLAVPDDRIPDWAGEMAKKGNLGYPAASTLLGTAAFMVAVWYSAFIYYGWQACICVGAIFIGALSAGVAGKANFRYRYPSTSDNLQEMPHGSDTSGVSPFGAASGALSSLSAREGSQASMAMAPGLITPEASGLTLFRLGLSRRMSPTGSD